MALSRRAKITAGTVGLTAMALFAASGSAFAADDEAGTELVIVEQANAPQAPAFGHAPGGCPDHGSDTSAVADTR